MHRHMNIHTQAHTHMPIHTEKHPLKKKERIKKGEEEGNKGVRGRNGRGRKKRKRKRVILFLIVSFYFVL